MTLIRKKPIRPIAGYRDKRAHAFSRPAFSLLEVMIALIILGLGMVMAATIFPVAWQRARQLSEHTVRQAVLPAATLAVETLVPASGPDFTAAGFAGDLLYDADYYFAGGYIVSVSDTRVHAMHLENIQVEQPQFVSENPWQSEYQLDLEKELQNDLELSPGPDKSNPLNPLILIDRTYQTPQIAFHQRVQPPMPKRIITNAAGLFSNFDTPTTWDDTLASRKHVWGVLHRLREYVGPNPNVIMSTDERIALAAQQIGSSRSFEMYYVLLRKPQSTLRYALQDPTTAPVPNLFNGFPQFAPGALAGKFDVMFPVPWRVEIRFAGLKNAANFTGVPTEITIPPINFPTTPGARATMVQMFPRGAQFVDELSGDLYRVAKRRVIGFEDDPAFRAVLTLDREIFIEDLDLEPTNNCNACGLDGTAIPQELLRTVWIYPPPAEPRNDDNPFPTYKAAQPVVSIDVRNVNIPASQ